MKLFGENKLNGNGGNVADIIIQVDKKRCELRRMKSEINLRKEQDIESKPKIPIKNGKNRSKLAK